MALIITLLFQNCFVHPVKHAADIRLKAVLISDIHADADPTRDRTNTLREIFAAIGKTQNGADAIVMSGDLTNSGDLLEYFNLQNCLNVYCRIANRIPEMGNHDSWNHSDDPDYTKAETYFKTFCAWNFIRTDHVYYAKQVNGISFLVLGVEDCDFDDPYHSDAQLDWFESELNDAVSEKNPVFVVCHKDLRRLGNSAGRIEEILTRAAEAAAAPIIFVSGHYHTIGGNTYKHPAEQLIYLNLPSVEYTDDGGLGFVAEVFDHKVILTGMSFLLNKPLDGYEFIIEF